jgi:Protein of unknown function (DUF3168)
MTLADPSLQLQKALVARLKADAGLTALIDGRIYDAVPINAIKPYLSFGPFEVLPERGDCIDGAEVVITLDGWAAGPDTVQVKRLGAAVAIALDEATFTLDMPQRLVEMLVEPIRYLRDPDNITAHAVITVRAMCEPTETIVAAAGFAGATSGGGG